MQVEQYALFVIDNIKRAKIGNIMNITDKVIENYDAKEFITALYNALLSTKAIPLNKNIIDSVNNALYSIERDGNLNKQMILDKMIIYIWKECNK